MSKSSKRRSRKMIKTIIRISTSIAVGVIVMALKASGTLK